MKHATLKFGDPVNITEKYYRSRSGSNHRSRFWKRVPYKKECCIYLGLRLLKNGNVYYEFDEGYYFEPKEHFKATLVSPGENLNPVYVPLDCIKFDKGY